MQLIEYSTFTLHIVRIQEQLLQPEACRLRTAADYRSLQFFQNQHLKQDFLSFFMGKAPKTNTFGLRSQSCLIRQPQWFLKVVFLPSRFKNKVFAFHTLILNTDEQNTFPKKSLIPKPCTWCWVHISIIIKGRVGGILHSITFCCKSRSLRSRLLRMAQKSQLQVNEWEHPLHGI